MLTKRIIPCLDVKNGRVVKGRNFLGLKDAGSPLALAEFYYKEGADELVFLDISASLEGRKTTLEIVKKIAKEIFIPFTVGGGINSFEQVHELLNAGADKVSINTAAVKNPQIISKSAEEFGSQCIISAIDAKRIGNSWNVFIYGGNEDSGIDALEWIKKAEDLGAGELLLTSMDCDGMKKGYDIELLRAVSKIVNIPVIASGGAGNPGDLFNAFYCGNADAALAASIFHFGEYSIGGVKNYLKKKGIPIRID